MVKQLKVGMLGYAFMGRAHSNAYNQIPKFFPDIGVEPVKEVVCGRSEEPLQEMASQFGWNRTETDWEKLMTSYDLDIFDNCGPNNFHLEPNIAAAEAGIDIVCEKPLARTLAEAKQMAEVVKKTGVKTMVAFNYRRVPAVQLAKKLIEDGFIGRIFHWRAVYLQDWIIDPEFPLVWRLQKDKAGSGPHGDLNAHIIDLARYLVGEIDQVIGMEETFIKERPLPGGEGGELGAQKSAKTDMGTVDVDDAVLFLAKFASGALGSFEATRFANGRRNFNSFEINGSKGSVVFNLERMNELQVYSSEDPEYAQGFRRVLVTEPSHKYANRWWPSGHIIGWEHTFTHELADFLEAIAKETPVMPDFQDAVKTQAVLEKVKDSIGSKSWERLPEL